MQHTIKQENKLDTDDFQRICRICMEILPKRIESVKNIYQHKVDTASAENSESYDLLFCQALELVTNLKVMYILSLHTASQFINKTQIGLTVQRKRRSTTFDLFHL